MRCSAARCANDPAGLHLIRRAARTSIAWLESIYGRRNFHPYIEQQSVDYAIIDPSKR